MLLKSMNWQLATRSDVFAEAIMDHAIAGKSSYAGTAVDLGEKFQSEEAETHLSSRLPGQLEEIAKELENENTNRQKHEVGQSADKLDSSVQACVVA